MRLFTINGPRLLLVAGVALLAPGLGLAQSASNSFQSAMYCTYVNSYTQFCNFAIGQSNLDITPSTGAMSTYALTEAIWGFVIEQTQCESANNGNPNACVPPYSPTVSSYVQTTINPTGTTSAVTTSTSNAQLTLPLSGTLTATQAGTYTETSYHSTSFNPPGTGSGGETQAQVAYTPPQPSITSISPDQWQVGASTPVTLTVANVGTSPTVSISDPNGSNLVSWTTSSVALPYIYGTATVSASDPGGETVTVTVTAGGSGNNFGSGGSGSSESASDTATVVAAIQISISGKSFIFVGTDPQELWANTYSAINSQPSGGTLSATSSDSSDTVKIVTGPPPEAQFTTTDQSKSNSDRTLTFTYASGGQSQSQTMQVTARQFAYVTNTTHRTRAVSPTGPPKPSFTRSILTRISNQWMERWV